MKGYNTPPSSKAVAGYRKTYADSNTAPGMGRLSPSGGKLNAKGAKGKMNGNVKQGSGKKMTDQTKAYAKMTMKQPANY